MNYQYPAKILNVVDGDTFDALVDLGFHTQMKCRFRLARVDTPEMNSVIAEDREKAILAKSKVLKLLGLDVTIQSSKGDKYGRWLAEVWFLEDGVQVNLSDRLLSEGLARPWK